MIASPVAVETDDLLTQAINVLRPLLATGTPKERIHIFWASAKAARDLATADVLIEEFTKVADETGLTAALGRHGAEDIAHVIRWAGRGWNPFEKGPLK